MAARGSEWACVLPMVVHQGTDADALLAVDYPSMVSLLVDVLQQQRNMLAEQDRMMAEQESHLSILEARLQTIEARR